MRPLITLLTDFGVRDSYVGQVKGVILGILPEATIVDLTHEVPPQDVRAGAMLLESAVIAFPPYAVHLAIVDPGVGTDRAAIAVRGASGIFVGPDNGLLSAALSRTARPARRLPERVPLPEGIVAVRLEERQWWREPVSPTFHGRDIFAPVAARLAAGQPLDSFGPALPAMLALPQPRAQRAEDGSLQATVIAIDRFGNLITDCHVSQVDDAVTIICNGHTIRGLVTTYGSASGLITLVGSSGYVEIARAGGSAAETMGARIGDVAVVWPAAEG